MSRLNLPEGVDTGFRLELWDAFGNRFTANIYGAGRQGWFLATHKWFGRVQSLGPQPLARGQWREFLGLVKQAGFWELPATLPANPDVETDDGEWLSLAGRVGSRYHQVHRDGGGAGLFQVQRFLTRLSGFFPDPRPTHPAQGLALQGEQPDAEPHAAPDPAT
jgi:hypothetical protein